MIEANTKAGEFLINKRELNGPSKKFYKLMGKRNEKRSKTLG